MSFIKYQGLGNDFVVIDSRKTDLSKVDLHALAVDICDRHFGVGADGLIIVWPSTKAHYRMQIINSDGSEPEMCGNGIRCFAKYVFEVDKLKEEVISVETKAGIIVPAVILEKGVVVGAEVDMGIPSEMTNVKLQMTNYGAIEIYSVSIGNPHAVNFVDDFAKVNISEIGPQIENHPHFPNKTNVEFARIINDHEIELKVWERGAGETLACGTGACALVAAAVLLKKTGRKVLVKLPGGNLDIEWQASDNHIIMRGPAEKVFEGSYSI
ncbi:diaminopimelate epimerase [Candidatus Saganbacteria bacterium]|nr:diaminopimelate epimerase [Candidatus Saganbacteria bacterium]